MVKRKVLDMFKFRTSVILLMSGLVWLSDRSSVAAQNDAIRLLFTVAKVDQTTQASFYGLVEATFDSSTPPKLVFQETQISGDYSYGFNLAAIAWSPDTQRLLIVRPGSTGDNLCIYSKGLDAENCFERIVFNPKSDGDTQQIFASKWSLDGSRVSYASQQSDGTITLVEADAFTYKTIRTVVEVSPQNYSGQLSWSPQLSYLIVGSGDNGELGVSDKKGLYALGDETLKLNSDSTRKTFLQGRVTLCQNIASDGRFFVIDNYGQMLTLMDTEGNSLVSVESKGTMTCPFWSSDETSFFYTDRKLVDDLANTSINQFNLRSSEERTWFSYSQVAPDEGAFYLTSPLHLSSDGKLILFGFNRFSTSSSDSGVAIVNELGDFYEIGKEYSRAVNPIWIPS